MRRGRHDVTGGESEPEEVPIMFCKAFRLVFAVVAISALVGCASFQDSFGEITDLFGPGVEQPAANSDTTATAQAPDSRAGQKILAVGGVMVQLSDGRLVE
jgi:hypothetical protein